MILDTNTPSAFVDGVSPVVQQIATADELHVPVIVLGEYRFGIATSRRRREYERWLERGRSFWNVLSLVEDMATNYASIRQQLTSAGVPLPANDVWIGAPAQQHDLPILSRDAHFDAVSDLTRIS
jgi:tRNA(fMet)-specific endonuclease VapC